MSFAEFAGGIAGPVLGGLVQMESQYQANRSNETIANNATAANMAEAERNREFQQASARESMGFSEHEATRQMEFQERMSNTAYQRASNDMKAAGINPIYFTGANASTPSGAAGSGASASGSQGSAVALPMRSIGDGLGSMVSSALEGLQLNARLKNMEAQSDLMGAQAARERVDARVKAKDIPKSDLINDGYDLIRPYVKKLKEALQSSPKPQKKDPKWENVDLKKLQNGMP